MADIKMIIGLGNPGKKYENTRHNIGYKVIEVLSRELNIDIKRKKFGSLFGSGRYKDTVLMLLKPATFMNRSGAVVAAAIDFYRLELENMLVITDDMDLSAGKIRIRSKGSSGGHNGLQDIIDKLGTSEFCRLRIGIGKADVIDAVDYVLGRPREDEKPLLTDAVQEAAEAVLCWLQFGIQKTMNRFNA